MTTRTSSLDRTISSSTTFHTAYTADEEERMDEMPVFLPRDARYFTPSPSLDDETPQPLTIRPTPVPPPLRAASSLPATLDLTLLPADQLTDRTFVEVGGRLFEIRVTSPKTESKPLALRVDQWRSLDKSFSDLITKAETTDHPIRNATLELFKDRVQVIETKQDPREIKIDDSNPLRSTVATIQRVFKDAKPLLSALPANSTQDSKDSKAEVKTKSEPVSPKKGTEAPKQESSPPSAQISFNSTTHPIGVAAHNIGDTKHEIGGSELATALDILSVQTGKFKVLKSELGATWELESGALPTLTPADLAQDKQIVIPFRTRSGHFVALFADQTGLIFKSPRFRFYDPYHQMEVPEELKSHVLPSFGAVEITPLREGALKQVKSEYWTDPTNCGALIIAQTLRLFGGEPTTLEELNHPCLRSTYETNLSQFRHSIATRLNEHAHVIRDQEARRWGASLPTSTDKNTPSVNPAEGRSSEPNSIEIFSDHLSDLIARPGQNPFIALPLDFTHPDTQEILLRTSLAIATPDQIHERYFGHVPLKRGTADTGYAPLSTPPTYVSPYFYKPLTPDADRKEQLQELIEIAMKKGHRNIILPAYSEEDSDILESLLSEELTASGAKIYLSERNRLLSLPSDDLDS